MIAVNLAHIGSLLLAEHRSVHLRNNRISAILIDNSYQCEQYEESA